DRYIRAPIIKSFSPGTSTLTSAVGDSLNFSIAAMDPDDQDLDYCFVLGDSIAGEGAEWTYVVDDTGNVDVRGQVSNGRSESEIRWHLKRIQPVNLPPEITGVDPPEAEITVVLGGEINFTISAVDPEGEALSYVYSIGDSIVSVSRRYTYEPPKVGLFEIRAVVSDGESFVSHAWTVRVAAEPDSIAPSQVVVVSVGPGAETGEVDIEWTAVGDDGMTGLPSYYVLRTSPMPITDEHAWNSSSERPGEPAPLAPGETMRMAVRNLPPAKTVYVAVRATDDFGNVSPISDLASTVARGMKVYGTVRDAVTAVPAEGVALKLLGSADTTGADGTFVLAELPAGVSGIFVSDENFSTEMGSFFDMVISPYTIKDKDVLDVWVLPNTPLDTDVYENFYDFYCQMTALPGIGADYLPSWQTPCRVYVPALVKNNIDYGQTVRDMFNEWEETVGKDLFMFVSSVPDTGVYVEYVDDTERDAYQIMLEDGRGLQIQGRIRLRTVYTEADLLTFQVTIRHEIGHCLGMNHSLDTHHLMVEAQFPAVTHPTSDEVKLAKAMYHIPRGTPAVWYRRD
ncbi:MAG: peptidase, partial [Candidatus Krumholzibacteriota bacterium]|nr:peptidase [Candidatus Krumholzibacteriota bacterium]